MDTQLKLLTAGALVSVGLAGAAFVVPSFGDADHSGEPRESPPARVLLSPVILPAGQGSRNMAKPLQLILTVNGNAVAQVCSLEPRIHDALMVHGIGVGKRGLRATLDRGLGGAAKAHVLAVEVQPGPPVIAGQERRKDVSFDYRCADGELAQVR